MSPRVWYYLWVACFITASAAFVAVWLLVFIKGFKDLRIMADQFRGGEPPHDHQERLR